MRLPAEWEAQQLVLFTFPRSRGDWGTHFTAVAEALIAAANAVYEVCPVLLIVSDEEDFAPYEDRFRGEVIHLRTDDCWVRDYGPITTVFEERVLVLNDFVFNGWGNKFSAKYDTGIPQRLWRAEFPESGYRAADLVLEGGSIESDGRGTILTTSKCLFAPNRNDWTEKATAEAVFADYFGTERTLWLERGALVGDDTDAHVDTLARFLAPDTIAYVQCTNESDEHYTELKAMEAELTATRTATGEPYHLVALPLPPAVHSADDNRRLPATYANFLISNGTLFLPTYFDDENPDHPGHRTDQQAADRLRSTNLYKVVPVNARPFLEQHGSLHCLTMQIPADPDN